MNEPTSFNEVVITVSEEQLARIGRDKCQVSIDAGTLKLTKVLFVPGLAVNLISVSQLDSKGISVVFGAKDASRTFMFKHNVIAHVDKMLNQFLLRNEVYLTTMVEDLHTGTKETYVFSLTKRSMNDWF